MLYTYIKTVSDFRTVAALTVLSNIEGGANCYNLSVTDIINVLRY